MDSWEFHLCAGELPPEVAEIVARKMQIIAAPIRASAGFDDYALSHCADYVRALAHGGAIRDTLYAIENRGKCAMGLVDDDGSERIYRKSPSCYLHGCTHDW